MSQPTQFDLSIPNAKATRALGQLLAETASVGDVFLLSGPVGAGKSELARAFIRHRLGRMEDVPSPTFTLVQTYEAEGGDIWHADLYRLSHPDEAVELGLTDAFETAITLIEWPDRLGDLTPPQAISIALSYDKDARRALISLSDQPKLAAALGAWHPHV